MKKTRRWRWLGYVLTGIILLVTTGYFTFIYKFKEILKAVIETESHGRYTLNASSVKLSLWDQKITLNNVKVSALDSAQASADYFISAQKVYLSIQSLHDVMFKNKLVVYDIIINEPFFRINVHTDKPKGNDNFHPSTVTDIINNLTQRLQVRSLNIKDASFEYTSYKYEKPFLADHINLKIMNFRKKDSMTNDLMYTDDIDLSITNQAWKFPGGNQDLNFTRLHYSAKDQYVQIDTSTIIIRGKKNADTVALSADQFRFSPRRLQEHLANDEFVVDSLICLKPILVLRKGQGTDRDSIGSISGALNQMFTRINLRYINIVKGSFAIFENNRSSSSYSTEQADIKIYNLQAIENHAKPLSVDSVMFNLNNLTFLTRDSLYQLTVGKFALRNNDLTFIDASFGNAPGNTRPAHMGFITPELHFRNIDLEELLKKKLKAPAISVYKPNIRLYTTEKKPPDSTSPEKFSLKSFYKVIHGLDELINVDSFHIVDGNMQLRSSKNNFNADINSINGVILINKFLKSDSLVDIKRAMPEMDIQMASVSTPQLKLTLDNFRFVGVSRHSYVETISLSLPTGSRISAKNLNWDILDWDVLQKSKIIQIQNLSIGELTTHIEPGSPAKKKNNELPPLMIATLEIGSLGFGLINKSSSLKLNADKIYLTDISTLSGHLNWTNMGALVDGFHYKKNGLEASFKSMAISDKGIQQLRDASIHLEDKDKEINFRAPLLNLSMNLQSADFAKLLIGSLASDTGTITIFSRKNPATTQSVSVSVPTHTEPAIRKQGLEDIFLSQLSLRNNSVIYGNKLDSIEAKTTVDISGKSIVYQSHESQPLRFEKLSLAMREFEFHHNQIHTFTRSFNADFADGQLTLVNKKVNKIRAGVELNWNALDLAMMLKDSGAVKASDISGTFQKAGFEFSPGTQLDWVSLVKLATVYDARISFESPDLKAETADVRWDGPESTFSTGKFSVRPKTNAATAAIKQRWQRDEILIDGESVVVKGIKYDADSGDPTLGINKIILEKIDLHASRDKRIPFRHGIDKPMPTKLISSIGFPFAVDSLIIVNSNITINEISAKTKKTGTIPLKEVEATLTNIRSRAGADDVLSISANAIMLDNRIDHMKYDELYADSLSPFVMKFYASPMELTNFTKATQPLANVGVKDGSSDTLYAHWIGNKNAAIGRMNFHYKDLKIALLNKDNPEKKLWTLRFANFLANALVQNSNSKEAIVYFERDQEKFVFNYWVKTTFSGLMSSVGIKRNRKYVKQYRRAKERLSLPDMPPVAPVDLPFILTSSY